MSESYLGPISYDQNGENSRKLWPIWAVTFIGLTVLYILYLLQLPVWPITDVFGFFVSALFLTISIAISIYHLVTTSKKKITVMQVFLTLIIGIFLLDMMYNIQIFNVLLNKAYNDEDIIRVDSFMISLCGLGISIGALYSAFSNRSQYQYIQGSVERNLSSSVIASRVIFLLVLLVFAVISNPFYPITIPFGMESGRTNPMAAVFSMLFTSDIAIINITFMLIGTLAVIASINREASATFVSAAQLTTAGIPAIITVMCLVGYISPPPDMLAIFPPDAGSIVSFIWGVANVSVYIIMLSMLSVFIDGAAVMRFKYG